LFGFRGLCSIYRSQAGEFTVRDNFDRNYYNNSHWLHSHQAQNEEHLHFTGVVGQPSKFVQYYDAASLYPSSGEMIIK
jgi:hypothetical protein